MRKIISLFIFFVVCFVFFNTAKSALAVCDYVCSGYNPDGSCANWYWSCGDPCQFCSCPAGQYCDVGCNCQDIGSGGGNTSCFPAGTKVKMEYGIEKNIENIQKGERVISDTGNGKEQISTVIDVEKPIRDNLCEINFTSEKILKLTSEHPIMGESGWKAIDPKKFYLENPDLSVDVLKIGDRIKREKGDLDEVKSFSCWSTQVKTYNLLLDNGLHTYFVDGVLVHNKAGRCPGGCCEGGPNANACGQCGNPPCCTNVAPDKPVINAPADGTQIRKGVATSLSWDALADWGNPCYTPNYRFQVCASDGVSGCNRLSQDVAQTATSFSWTPSSGYGTTFWNVTANNGALSNTSDTRTVCVEGFSMTDTNYVSNWTACDANHRHTRTCREDCGTDDCAPVVLDEDCIGQVRGTLFDASDMGVCPGFSAVTGYTTGLTEEGIANRTFGFTDQNNVAPHPWAPLSPITTDGNGNYRFDVYAPSNYVYDFSALSDKYWLGAGPKFTCISNVATVPDNNPACQTQPCTLVNGMSFGFWRIYGGWWQVTGGSVHGEKGITSVIPSSLATEMSLILPDATGRRGFLSYDTVADRMIGTNPNAKVSESLWAKQSKYGSSPVYDWSFFNKRFNLFAKTEWNDGEAVNYDDKGIGYQIFRTKLPVTNFDFSPTGSQSAIFLVDGDVNINTDIKVPVGAFLAVISDGTITFSDNVATAEGWYVGNRISVACKDTGAPGCDKTDKIFYGNGSFVAWGNIDLARDREVQNNWTSSEKFTYRRDLYQNAPAPMKIYTKVFKPFTP